MSRAIATSQPAKPISTEKLRLASALTEGLDSTALNWLCGYMAGAAAQRRSQSSAATPAATDKAAARLTLLYGSQTGNGKRIAEQMARQAEQAGLDVALHSTGAYRTQDLRKERLLYIVISTHSEGDTVEPPDDARGFIEFLESRRAPRLPELDYAVLALGDSSYPEFCAIGRKLDQRFESLGARRLQACGEADVDIDKVAKPWLQTALQTAAELLEQNDHAKTATAVVAPLHPAVQSWTRQRPFDAEVLLSQRIVASESGKDVRHMELSLAGSGLAYQPGDALGVWPRQATELVDALVAELGLDAATEVEYDGETAPLDRWLSERRELTTLTPPFLALHAERGAHAELAALLEPAARAKLTELFESHQLLDLLRRWPTTWDAHSLVAALRPLAPRMYSIASSLEAVGDEVHLTVARLQYRHNDEARGGVATRHLCDLAEGDTVSVFLEANDRFRLPADSARDVIMIGPGTGVAPFRAFVQQRREQSANGRSWLFFGNPHRRTDFLYQLEWQQALRDGELHRLTVAFSRDQKEKIYVQDRVREHGKELWSWLESGAHLYLCGDANRMAPDVHRALLDVVTTHGGKSADQARQWLTRCMVEGRYARDVY